MLLHYTDTGTGAPIVLLHGMAASSRYWQNLIPHIQPGHRVIAIDLLGFGRSPAPKHITYSYETHIQSILETLAYLNVGEPYTLVGHSMGALIALRLASGQQANVSKVILVAMPVYATPQESRRAITNNSRLKKWAYYGTSSKALCTLWCRFLRPVSGRIAPLYLRHLTHEAAQDSVLHTWQAYSQSLANIIENQTATLDLVAYKKMAILIYGTNDVPHNIQSVVKQTGHTLVILDGTHQIIHEHPLKIAQFILP